MNCWKKHQQNANFGVFRADEYSAASGLNTGFAGHRNPANRVDTGFDAKCRNKKKPQVFELAAFKVAGWTRLELATSCVTGRVILNNYQFIRKLCWKIVGCSSSKYILFYLSVNLANYLLIASKKSIFYFI